MSKNVKHVITNEEGKPVVLNSKGEQVTVYLASGFFNDSQKATVKRMESFLEDRGYRVFSPFRDGITLKPNASQEERDMVFKENVENSTKLDLVIANVDGLDSGTMVEIGLRYGYWYATRNTWTDDPQEVPRMITFSNEGWKLNVMLSGAVLSHCRGFEELATYLDYVESVGLDNAKVDMNKYTTEVF